jgi:hypothetical protein
MSDPSTGNGMGTGPPRPDIGKYRGAVENPLPLLAELVLEADNRVTGS